MDSAGEHVNISREDTPLALIKMVTLLTKVCFVFLVLETLVGMVANGSIVLINSIDWFRREKLSPTDLILTSLSIARLLLQAVMILIVTKFILLKNIMNNEWSILMHIWLFTNAMNLWFAACLSVFYLAKIAIFSHPVFLQVKLRISRLIPTLLLGSVVFSAVLTFIAIPIWNYGSRFSHYKSLSSNRSSAEMNMSQTCRDTFSLYSAFDLIPFMVFLSSSIFLLSSLWKHMRRVQANGTGTRDLNTQAHLSAIKALASFAVLYLISFAASISLSHLDWNNQHSWTTVIFNVSAVYPSGHAIILILINPKLKQAWVRMLQHFKRG